MSCNAIELKTSEILNSTFRSRVFELTIPADNRNPANDVYAAKVKIKGTEILEIPGNIVGNRVIFQLTELEDTNKFTDYEIDYWANLDVLGKELFAQEQLRVASKVQPDRCTPDVVAGTLNFGDVVVQAQVTMPVLVLEQHTNNYLDYDSLTPEQKEEITGKDGDNHFELTDSNYTDAQLLDAFIKIDYPWYKGTKQDVIDYFGIDDISDVPDLIENSYSTELRDLYDQKNADSLPDAEYTRFLFDLITYNDHYQNHELAIITDVADLPSAYSLLNDEEKPGVTRWTDYALYAWNHDYSEDFTSMLQLGNDWYGFPEDFEWPYIKSNQARVRGNWPEHPEDFTNKEYVDAVREYIDNITTGSEITAKIEIGKNLKKEGGKIDVKIPELKSETIEISIIGTDSRGVAVDSLGNIYTSNYLTHNVTKSTHGGVNRIIGPTGLYPTLLELDSAGNIYVVNTSNSISKITPAGASSIVATTGNNINGIAIDKDGNVYTASASDNNVTKITPGGTSSIIGTTGAFPYDVAVDGAGNVYTANRNSNNISKITPAGVSTIFATTGRNPSGVTADYEGNVYVANTVDSNVIKITPSGVSSILGTTGKFPIEIVLDSKNNIYTRNSFSNSISKITPEGVSEIIYNPGVAIQSLAVDKFGNVYTVRIPDNKLIKIAQVTDRKLAVNEKGDIIRVGSYSFDEKLTGNVWIDGKEIFRKVIMDGDAHPAGIDALIREQTVGGHVILEYTKN